MLPKNFCISLLGIILIGLCLLPLNGQTKQEKEVLRLVAQADSLSEFRRGTDALKVAKKALMLATQIDYPLGKAKASYEIANACYDIYEDKYVDSIKIYADNALFIAHNLDNKALQGDILIQLGRYNKNYGSLVDAARYYQQALNFLLLGKDSLKIATVYNNLSSTYLEFEQVEEACYNSDLAIKHWPKFKPTNKTRRYLASFYINFSNALGATAYSGSLKKAIDCSSKAIEIAKSIQSDITMFEGFYGLGQRYYEKGDYSLSISTFQKALDKSQNPSDRIMTLEALSISTLYFDKKKGALLYINDAEKMAKDSHETASLVSIYTSKGEILNFLGEYKASNEVLGKALKLIDNERIGNVNEIKSRIEINIVNNHHSLALQTNYSLIVGILIIILISISIIAYFRLRASEAKAETAEAKIKETAALAKKKDAEKLAVLLQLEAAEIKAVAEKQEKERNRLIHVAIKGDLRTLKLRLKLAKRDKSQLENSEIIKKIDAIMERFWPIDRILTVAAFAEQVFTTAQHCIISEETNIKFMPELNEANGSLLKGKIFKELETITDLAFTNIERHAKASEAQLIVEAKNSELLLEINDNGIGFDIGQIDESKEGLQDIRDRAKDIGGQCFINSVIGCGTNIRIIVRNPYEQIHTGIVKQ